MGQGQTQQTQVIGVGGPLQEPQFWLGLCEHGQPRPHPNDRPDAARVCANPCVVSVPKPAELRALRAWSYTT